MKYGSMGSALPTRFKCVCGSQHPIDSRTYIELGKDEFPIGCRKGKEIIEAYKKHDITNLHYAACA